MASNTPLTEPQLQTLRASVGSYLLRFQQQLSSLEASKSAFSTSAPAEVTVSHNIVLQEFANLQLILRTGYVNGRLVTDGDFTAQNARLSESLKAYAQAIESWNARSPTAWLSKAADAALSLAAEIGSQVTGPIRFVKNLVIWGAVFAGAVILLPPLLRTFSAYKKGGSTAAADEFSNQLERGQRAMAEAAKKTRDLATRAAAAYASGGTSEALRAKMAGTSTKRLSRRRSR